MDVTPLIQSADTKILLVVMDGLGGYADADHGTELEEATTPHLDQLAAEGTTGLCEPVGPGITPGSGPGHLGLFGYDPERVRARAAARCPRPGSTSSCEPGDVAARGNLCTLGADGTITDRRAGRIPDDEAQVVVDKLQAGVHLDGTEVFFRHEREHRLLVVLRGPGLDPRLTDTDPQHDGRRAARPSRSTPRRSAPPSSSPRSTRRCGACSPTSRRPTSSCSAASTRTASCPGSRERYGLRAAAVAIYPMYRGIARLLGMDVLGRPADLVDQLEILRARLGRLRLLLPAPQVHRLRG